MIQAHPLRVLQNLIFIIPIGILFLWLSQVPQAIPSGIAQVSRSMRGVRRILVPVDETLTSERGVELACRLGQGKDLEIILAYITIVPYTLSLNASLPDQDARAQESLEMGLGIAKEHTHLTRTRIVRHRNLADAILKVGREEKVDAIVLSVGHKAHIPGQWAETSAEILQRAECEVIVDQVPISAQPIALPA